jgi:hypothetical protein
MSNGQCPPVPNGRFGRGQFKNQKIYNSQIKPLNQPTTTPNRYLFKMLAFAGLHFHYFFCMFKALAWGAAIFRHI